MLKGMNERGLLLHRVDLNYVLYVLKQLHFLRNQHCLVAFFRLFGVFGGFFFLKKNKTVKFKPERCLK